MGRLFDVIAPARLGTAFRWNLASVWVGNLGDGIALAAGPLLIASQTRSPLLIAAGAMVQRVPTLLIGLYAGALADRLDRRRMAVLANVARAVVILALLLTIVTGMVSIGVVLAAMFLLGCAEQFADSATRAVLPMIVERRDLGIGNARMLAGYLVANELIGPSVGAVLFAAGMAIPFGAQAAAVLLAAWLFTKVDLPTRGHDPAVSHRGRRVGTDIRAGLRWIWASPPVRTLSVMILVFNLTWGAPWGVLVLWAQERLGVTPVGFGLLSTAVGIGGLVAIVSYDWLEGRFSLEALMKVCLVLEVVLHGALALTTHLAIALGLMFVFGCYAFIWASVGTAVRQRATPADLQGRVGSVYAFGLMAGLIVGQFLGGVIASRWGPAAPFWFAFVGSGLTLAVLWRGIGHIAHAGTPQAPDGIPSTP